MGGPNGGSTTGCASCDSSGSEERLERRAMRGRDGGTIKSLSRTLTEGILCPYGPTIGLIRGEPGGVLAALDGAERVDRAWDKGMRAESKCGSYRARGVRMARACSRDEGEMGLASAKPDSSCVSGAVLRSPDMLDGIDDMLSGV